MRIIIGSLLLASSFFGYAADTLTMTVDPSSPQFVVTLPSNPTTGFQWKVTTYNKKLFQMTDSHYVAPQTKLIGAGGQMTFTFALAKGKTYPQTTQMTFTYARSWDPKSGTVKQVTVNFIKNSGNQ